MGKQSQNEMPYYLFTSKQKVKSHIIKVWKWQTLLLPYSYVVATTDFYSLLP